MQILASIQPRTSPNTLIQTIIHIRIPYFRPRLAFTPHRNLYNIMQRHVNLKRYVPPKPTSQRTATQERGVPLAAPTHRRLGSEGVGLFAHRFFPFRWSERNLKIFDPSIQEDFEVHTQEEPNFRSQFESESGGYSPLRTMRSSQFVLEKIPETASCLG